MERLKDEEYISYVKRVTSACSNKQITYSEWGDYILGTENVYSDDNCRKGFYIVSKLIDKLDSNCEITDDKLIKEIEIKKRELQKYVASVPQ